MTLGLEVAIERKGPGMAAFIGLPAGAVAALGVSGTTTVEGTLDAVAIGRRSLLRAGARGRWEALSSSRQRLFREELLATKTTEARPWSASKALTPCPAAAVPTPVGLPARPRPVLLRVTGRPLPGLRCGPCTEARVGTSAGRVAFRGPAVRGAPPERFVYLAWVGRLNGELQHGFRRAKLRLDTVPAEVLAAAASSGVLLAELDLREDSGLPICGSVRPPRIRWSAGAAPAVPVDRDSDLDASRQRS